MKKLEDIPKKNIFTVPDGYFDELPGIIQARIATNNQKANTPVFSYALKYTLPVILILITSVVWLYLPSTLPADTTETFLVEVQTEDLVAYLDDSGITLDDVLESVPFDSDDLNEIEESAYGLNMNDEELENIIDVID